MATVTAGLRCAPDTLANADVSMAAAKPDAKAVLICTVCSVEDVVTEQTMTT